MVYTIVIFFALLVIAVIDGFAATGALQYDCIWFFFCISTLESLFIAFLGLKPKM